MVVGVVLIALMFWVGVFVTFFTMQGITPFEFFLGRYEPLPDDLGIWKEVATNEQDGLLREERLLLPEGRTNAGYLRHQVRYRRATTGEIVSVEPERRVRRRRVSVRSQ